MILQAVRISFQPFSWHFDRPGMDRVMSFRRADPLYPAFLTDTEEIVAEYDDMKIAAVLRIFPRTNPGARLLKGVTTFLVLPEKDLGIDLEAQTARRSGRRSFAREDPWLRAVDDPPSLPGPGRP